MPPISSKGPECSHLYNRQDLKQLLPDLCSQSDALPPQKQLQAKSELSKQSPVPGASGQTGDPGPERTLLLSVQSALLTRLYKEWPSKDVEPGVYFPIVLPRYRDTVWAYGQGLTNLGSPH